MTTKEQERKALEQIRKIVNGLGEQSYIGTALEGCLGDAEQNIEYDAAFSMLSRWEDAESKSKELQSKLNDCEAANKRLTERVAAAESAAMKPELAISISNDYNDQMEAARNDLSVASQAMIDMVGAVHTDSYEFIEAAERVAYLKRRIAHLESVKTQIDQYIQ